MSIPCRPPRLSLYPRATAAALLACVLLGTAGPVPAQSTRLRADPAVARPCPGGLPPDARCLVGRDYLGAGYWMAMPARWNGELVVHVRDHQLESPAPRIDPPLPEPAGGDLARWSVWVRAGYAWAGSTLRHDHYDTASAVDDSERLRQAFIAEFGRPQFTWLHGHGWGAIAATRMAERFTTPDIDARALRGAAPSDGRTAAPAKRPYDGVLLTNGLLAGERSDDLVLDARVVYQAVCNNHPRPDEAPYPVWMGLPLEGRLSPEDLAARIDACTGVARKPAERTAAQQRALQRITQTLGVPAEALPTLLARSTWQFQAMVWRRLGGRNAWGNEGVRYRGEDDALQARIARYRADPAALALLASDLEPGTRLHLPVLSLHAVRDGVAVVEQEAEFREALAEAGTQGNLLQLYVDDGDHAVARDAPALAALAVLRDWAQSGHRPAPADAARRCAALDARWQPAAGCRLLSDYQPAVLETRVPQRRRERPADVASAVGPGASAALPAGSPSPASLPAAASADPRRTRLGDPAPAPGTDTGTRAGASLPVPATPATAEPAGDSPVRVPPRSPFDRPGMFQP